jgi:replicative DNA helicase
MPELVLEKPKNIEAEEAILGSIFIKPDVLTDVIQILKPQYFTSTRNKLVYESMLGCYEQSLDIDVITIAEKLNKAGVLDGVGGYNFLQGLINATPTHAYATSYANIVKDNYLLSNVIDIASGVIDKASRKDYKNVQEFVEMSVSNIYDYIAGTSIKSVYTMRQMLEEEYEILNHKMDNPGLIGFSTGFNELDALTGGLVPGDLFVVAGRTSMGKTSIALNLMLSLASQGTPVIMYTYEMQRGQIIERLLAMHSKVPFIKIRTGAGLTEDESQRLANSMGILDTYPIFVDTNATGDIHYIIQSLRHYHHKYGVRAVFVDYLQIIPTDTDDLTNEYGKMTRKLKNTAMSLSMPVILLSQLNRNADNKNRPSLADLRQSGRIEEDADIVLFVFRNRYEDASDSEFIIAKNRNGPLGILETYFEEEITSFKGR